MSNALLSDFEHVLNLIDLRDIQLLKSSFVDHREISSLSKQDGTKIELKLETGIPEGKRYYVLDDFLLTQLRFDLTVHFDKQVGIEIGSDYLITFQFTKNADDFEEYLSSNTELSSLFFEKQIPKLVYGLFREHVHSYLGKAGRRMVVLPLFR